MATSDKYKAITRWDIVTASFAIDQIMVHAQRIKDIFTEAERVKSVHNHLLRLNESLTQGTGPNNDFLGTDSISTITTMVTNIEKHTAPFNGSSDPELVRAMDGLELWYKDFVRRTRKNAAVVTSSTKVQ